MTIKVYGIDRDDGESYEIYTKGEGEEYMGVFVDGKTPIIARAGREKEGFVLVYPDGGIAGKKNFGLGDTLALANDLELEGA